jgi:cytochrome c oxidase assembly protein subunit 15
MITANPQHLPAIRAWLITCMVMVALMVFIGGVTRLTESGLSIVEWKLFSGIFPPLSHAGWEEAFRDYQTSPEFQLKNTDFTLAEFQGIYWLEYLHRLLGRLTGLVFLIPLAVFAIRKQLPRPLFLRMFALCGLVGMQGTVGWIMVASGLEHDPRVNPLKLALHLSLAFTLFCALLWTWLQLSAPRNASYPKPLHWMIRATLGVTILQIILGALVAGHDAGLTYNTYPLMDGRWVPNGLTTLTPWARNIIENIVMVQWQHRMVALILVMSCLVTIGYNLRQAPPQIRVWLWALLSVIVVQFGLGVATLLSVVAIPLASAHQMAALLLLLVLVHLVYHTPKRA